MTLLHSWKKDLIASIVVFLVALPLCLGIALASNAPLFSGILAGIIGGIIIGSISGSQTSVSGPAAGLTAVVSSLIVSLGSFESFLLALVIGGVIQIGFGLAQAGALAAFFPSSVIKGLLAAIGVILILKQIPHLFGHDKDPEGEMSFQQPDHENTFSEFGELLGDIHPGATMIGLVSLLLLVIWDRNKRLKKSILPAPVVVVSAGIGLQLLFAHLGGRWAIQNIHLVQVPIASDWAGFTSFLRAPDFSQWNNPAIYSAAIVIAVVASLETLLNLEAVDKLDRHHRQSPASRELLAQGIGNLVGGLIGAIPVTAVIIRGSVNINSGAETKLSTILHGSWLFICVLFLPSYLNLIPLSCLAAILILTGFKLASPALFQKMWSDGRYQFLPFLVTLTAIVLTDLLIGILIGLGTSLIFILASNLRRPIRRIEERHVGGEVVRIELANQVSFLNRASLEKAMRGVKRGTHLLLDARHTDYIDPDVLSLIKEYKEIVAPSHGVKVSLKGFRDKYDLKDEIQFVDHSTRELQEQLTPKDVLKILMEGNERFYKGRRLDRNLTRQVGEDNDHLHPMAVILSDIDSATPAELIFDLGQGDAFTIRMAGNLAGPKVIGSIEYGCHVIGAKLLVIVGNPRSSIVNDVVEMICNDRETNEVEGCPHLDVISREIEPLVTPEIRGRWMQGSPRERKKLIAEISRTNVIRTVQKILEQSSTIQRLVHGGQIAIVGAMYAPHSGQIELLEDCMIGLETSSRVQDILTA